MNELLQTHGCANVFSVPEGLKELMSDISREVLRAQPRDVNDFIANYLSVLLITREHGVMAVKILDDLCDCRPSVLEHLQQLGLDKEQAQLLADVIKEEIEGSEEEEGKETVKEYQIVKKILARQPLDEALTAKVCQVARNAYRDYWYRKKTLEKGLKPTSDEPWEVAAEHTLELYKKTKPSFSELTRATEKIQAAYRGYHVRRNILRHLKPKSKKKGPKVDLPGAPMDLGGSREIDLGPLIDINVREDNVSAMFDQHTTQSLGLPYDPRRTITHVPDLEAMEYPLAKDRSEQRSTAQSQMSHVTPLQSQKLTSTISQIPTSKISQIESRIMSRALDSTPSRVSEAAIPRQSRLQSVELRLPSQMVDDNAAISRQSRLQSVENPPAIRLPNQMVDPAHIKISFSNIPPKVIQSEAAPSEADDGEIPEDIAADDRSDADGASAPTASMTSSAPSTAHTSEVEDETGLNTSADEAE